MEHIITPPNIPHTNIPETNIPQANISESIPHIISNGSSPLDTLAIVQQLEQSGTSRQQAEAHATIWRNIVTHNLATKSDIDNLRSGTDLQIENVRKDIAILRNENKLEIENVRKDIEILRNETGRNIAEIKSSLLMWLVPLVISQTAAIAAIIKAIVAS